MRKILIFGVAGLAALSSYGQGYVIFSSATQNQSTNNTGSSGGQIFGVGATAGKTTGTAGAFYYALFWSSTITSGAALQGATNISSTYAFNTPGWTFDADPTAVAASTGTAGRFAPLAGNSDGTTTVPGTIGGNSYNFVIVGWSANLGTTLAQMEGNLGTIQGYLGQSAVSGPITVGNGALIGASNVMGGVAPTIQAFTLGVTLAPEPGTLALVGLGSVSLLLFGRRK